ncbi:MAG TPA: MmgE/PrpD family protein [Candidatus Acidoferrales bacterium]|nr:MmgE/PrpD family protein [Candidatus Acidoferrales bacterium]
MKSYSELLGSFATALQLEGVPPEVREKAKLIFLDTLGVALASSTMDFGLMALEVARSLGGPKASRLIGTRYRVHPANAVLANGTLAHGLDYDDTLEEAIVHTGCCAVTTALAVGEAVGASGRQVLEAAIVATEIMCKVGVVAPGRFHARGFHPTAICATFGAAGAAGRLYKLSVPQMMDAFGICGSQSAGIIEYLADGSWTKRMHPGWSAHGGIIAALLARAGFRGPATVLEGRHGLYRCFGGDGEYQWQRLEELGRAWEIPKIAFKSYPCGSISHPYMDCALRLREKHSVRPGDVEEIVCRTAEGPVPRLWEPIAEKRRPSTSYGAKFSLPYSIACMIARGRAGLQEFSEDAIRDPEILNLAAKVRYELDPAIDYPRHFSGHVKIRMKDGRIFEENQPHPRGGLEDPLPPEEIEGKFRANAALAVSRQRAEQIMTAVRNLEAVPAITDLSRLLAGRGRSPAAHRTSFTPAS